MSRSKRLRSTLLAACIASACAGAAHASHPLQTEDTGTQGAGNVEWENGLSRARSAGAQLLVVYQPQLSYGLATPFDLIVQPSWVRQRDAAGSTVQGFGDTDVDVKWRLPGESPLSLAVRAGLTLATGQRGLGMPHGRRGVHALAVATYDAAPFAVHGNLGVNHKPAAAGERSTVGHLSAAVTWSSSEQLTLMAELGADSNAAAARRNWPVSGLVGAIYVIRPGLDIDIGWQSSIGATPGTRQWLVGMSYRFAP